MITPSNTIAYWAEKWRDAEQDETEARVELIHRRKIFEEAERHTSLARDAEHTAGSAVASASEYLYSKVNETVEAAKHWAEAKAAKKNNPRRV